MTKKKWTIYGAIAAVMIIAGFAVADETDLQARLAAAEARIAELSANATADSWLDKERVRQNRALVRSVLADAETRSMLQGNGSPVTVNVNGFVQTRFDYNGGGDAEANHGFSLPATRLILSGDIYDFGYKVSGQWSDGGNFELKDAYGTGEIAGLDFRFGQFKSPFMKEVLVSRVDTLAVDRSIVAYTFGQGRSQGIEFGKDFGALNLRAAYTDGFNSANGAGVQNGYALTARADWDVTDWWNFGAALSWNDLVDSDYTTYTVDTGIKFGGLDLTAAYVGVNRDAADNWATTFSAAYMCTEDLQGFLAYEFGELEGATENLSVLTVGANYFINDHVKWTTDFGYAMNGIDAGWDLGTTGWNASASEGEYLVRTQLQIQF
tara:strand:- start:727 stop:1866 length:1140 start_codon:yes stop_codon:yes gene_type:complete